MEVRIITKRVRYQVAKRKRAEGKVNEVFEMD